MAWLWPYTSSWGTERPRFRFLKKKNHWGFINIRPYNRPRRKQVVTRGNIDRELLMKTCRITHWQSDILNLNFQSAISNVIQPIFSFMIKMVLVSEVMLEGLVPYPFCKVIISYLKMTFQWLDAFNPCAWQHISRLWKHKQIRTYIWNVRFYSVTVLYYDRITYYRQLSSIMRTQSPSINVSRLVLQLSLPNPLKPRVKLRMKE